MNYQRLRDLIDHDEPVGVLTDTSEVVFVHLIKIGSGGSKTAYKWHSESAYVLILPNLSTGAIPTYWERMVREETTISSFLDSIGLLTVSSIPTRVYLDSTLNDGIPAYFSLSFEYLASKQMYVVDTKSWESYWPGHLFFSWDDMQNLDKWQDIFQDFLEDVYKVWCYKFYGGDTFNYIIDHGRLRFFGFDFSSKTRPRNLDLVPGCVVPAADLGNLSVFIRRAVEFIVDHDFKDWAVKIVPLDRDYLISQVTHYLTRSYELPVTFEPEVELDSEEETELLRELGYL